MWVSRCKRRIGLWSAALALAGPLGLLAQSESNVTDADIERARNAVPPVTEKDIEAARQRYRMPTDEELDRVPLPSIPNVDALPAPIGGRAIDLESVAKGYRDFVAPRTVEGASGALPTLLVFVSFSMPSATLERLVDQAARSEATLVIRGLVDGSLQGTVARVHRLIGNRRVAFEIDPQAFDRFAVRVTPTFVLLQRGAVARPCGAVQCYPIEAFASVRGDVSLDYALEYIRRSAPSFSEEAAGYLRKLGS